VLGYFLGGEGLGARTILGTLFVLVSVVVITTTPKKMSSARTQETELAEP
jgi:drug/metabolite transporter (DMT)-like permease